MSAAVLRPPTFWIKAALAAALVIAADRLFFDADAVGTSLGLFALAWSAAAALATPAVLRDPTGRLALLWAVAFAAVNLERPTLVGWLLFGLSLGVAVLAPRAGPAEDAWRWLQRVLLQGLKGLGGPLLDFRRLGAPRLRRRAPGLGAVAANAVLPLAGGLLFLWLFGVANPVIQGLLPELGLPRIEPARWVFWAMASVAVWGILRPRFLRRPRDVAEAAGDLLLPGVTPASITLSLIVFNALFALQNGLDIAFLWSGAALPEGMTHAEYAHRGAYPLVFTALLAGLFVLVFLRPGSPTASLPLVRRLVMLWVAQNLLLVASTILRTLAYVDAYSLTTLRIAALLWMGLVAVGLGLVGWRLVRGKSTSWLINANVAAAAGVLALCSVIDLSAVAAAWNVRHAREAGGRGAPLDVCYLERVGEAALVSLAELERRPLPADLRLRVQGVRERGQTRLALRQADWRGWSFRGARRLARVQQLAAGVTPLPPGVSWGCAGRSPAVAAPPAPPPAAPARPTAPLTAPAQPRT
ncbi:DUF4173 domain-containing protein [Phenylobacterium sp.]|jgi:hypothetical protein|uniref:DUF4153 domain-containing protein n=1 Tax=Phenylobacterium sp. TaxID=1871053 RepID=UPI002F9305FE